MSERPSRFVPGRGASGRTVPVEPWAARVCVSSTCLYAAPGGPRAREIVYGDRLDVVDEYDGWSFGHAAKDGYRGWIPTFHLGPDLQPTHAVRLRHAHAYPRPDIKLPPAMRLPFGASVPVESVEGVWAETPEGWIHTGHLRPLGAAMQDPVAVAAMFLGTPYLWAGNTGDGIDCSGLVQVACLACGVACPGDSAEQERALGQLLPEDAELRRGDLLFWKGHVAWVADPLTLLHATAFAMAVIYEPIAVAVARIEAAGDGPVTSRRRL